MKKIYCINYDLNNPGQKCESLHDLIKSCGDWYHIMGSSWLVYSSRSAKGIYNALQPALDSSDSILISHLDEDYYGCLNNAIWEWIKERL